MSKLALSNLLGNASSLPLPQWQKDLFQYHVSALNDAHGLVNLAKAYNTARQKGNIQKDLEDILSDLGNQVSSVFSSATIEQEDIQAYENARAIVNRHEQAPSPTASEITAKQQQDKEAESTHTSRSDENKQVEANDPELHHQDITPDAGLPAKMKGVFTGGAAYNINAGCYIGMVPVAKLSLSPEVPQVKVNSNKKGIVNPLVGEYSPQAPPIYVWKRKNGKLEVVSGRHRLDLAQRTASTDMLANVYEEDSTHNAQWAKLLDYEQNMQDDQADEITAAIYTRETNLSDAELTQRGLTRGGTKSARGILIGREARQDLWDRFTSGAIKAQEAEAICLLTKNIKDEDRIDAIQSTAAQDIAKGRSLDFVASKIQLMSHAKRDGMIQGLISFGDSFEASMEKAADYIAQSISIINDHINAIKSIRNISKKGTVMAAEGISAGLSSNPTERLQQLELLKAMHEKCGLYENIRIQALTWDGESKPDPIGDHRAQMEAERVAAEREAQELQDEADRKAIHEQAPQLSFSVTAQDKDGNTLHPDTFLAKKDGNIDWLHLKKGKEWKPIRLQIGADKGQHRGYGLTHIIASRSLENPKFWHNLSPEAYIEDICTNASELYEMSGRELLVKGKKPSQWLLLQLVDDGNFYSIVTAYPVRHGKKPIGKKVQLRSEPSTLVVDQGDFDEGNANGATPQSSTTAMNSKPNLPNSSNIVNIKDVTCRFDDGSSVQASFSVAQLNDQFKNGILQTDNAIIVKPEENISFSIAAWHGTPHDVDQFKLSAVGTGEGQQVYGWGLYFAEDKKVAEWYKSNLSSDGQGSLLKTSIDVEIEDLLPWENSIGQDISEAGEFPIISQKNSVKILGWENIKTYGELLESAERIEQEEGNSLVMEPLLGDMNELDREDEIEDFYMVEYYAALYVNTHLTGESIYEGAISITGSPKQASEWLLQQGIKGVIYADGNTRDKDEAQQTHNYVIFDEDIIKITEKNGVAMNAEHSDISFSIAPNGKKSNLTQKQWNEVRTEEFKKWFGDWEGDPENASKVVDENGEPMVVYHGTDDRFTRFDVSKLRDREGSFFFAQNKKDAEEYAGLGHVMAVFVNVRKPIDYEAFDFPSSLADKKAQVAHLKEEGYDGWLTGIEDGWGEISAFYPTQIKSATDNRGTFDSENSDISFSITPQDNEQWKNDLMEYATGGNTSSRPLRLSSMPDVFSALGYTEHDVVMLPNTIDKLKAKHDLTDEQIQALAQAINDPILIVNSATQAGNIVALTELKMHQGNIITPIHLDRNTKDGFRHVVASAYAENTQNMILRQIQNGETLYIDKKRALAWARSNGRQLPKVASQKDKPTILTPEDVVKWKNAQGENNASFSLASMKDIVSSLSKPSMQATRAAELIKDFNQASENWNRVTAGKNPSARMGAELLGTINSLISSARYVLPKGYRSNVRMQMQWASVFASMAENGEVPLKGTLQGGTAFYDKFKTAIMNQTSMAVTEEEAADMIAEIGTQRLDRVMEKAIEKIRDQLLYFAKDEMWNKTMKRVESAYPKKTTGKKSPKGKMETKAYRKLAAYREMLAADAEKKADTMTSLEAKYSKETEEDKLEDIESDIIAWTCYGNYQAMSIQQAQTAMLSLAEYIATSKNISDLINKKSHSKRSTNSYPNPEHFSVKLS